MALKSFIILAPGELNLSAGLYSKTFYGCNQIFTKVKKVFLSVRPRLEPTWRGAPPILTKVSYTVSHCLVTSIHD